MKATLTNLDDLGGWCSIRWQACDHLSTPPGHLSEQPPWPFLQTPSGHFSKPFFLGEVVSPSHFSLEKWLYIGEPHNTGGSASFLQTASGHFSNPLPAISPNHFRPFLQAGPAALPVPEAPPPAPPGLIPTARLAPIPISISRHAGKLHQRIAKELLVSAGGRLPHDWFATALQDAAW